MEWMTKFVFKLILLVVVVLIVLSFVRQVFSPVDKTYVMAGKGQLPEPMPAAGIGTVNAKEASPSVIPAPPVPPVTGIPTSPPPTSGASSCSSPSVSPTGSAADGTHCVGWSASTGPSLWIVFPGAAPSNYFALILNSDVVLFRRRTRLINAYLRRFCPIR